MALATGLILLGAACSSSSEQAPVQQAALRLYVFDCGEINVGTTNFGLEPEEVAVQGFFTPCYLVVHPDGTLMWDSGEIPDANLPPDGSPSSGGAFVVTKALLPQLAEVGFEPANITYFAMSHFHGDHSANANAFAGSTWLVQEVERTEMFSPDATTTNYAALENSETVLLHGDHDVFGDGSVVIKSTPGHTVGHQALFLRLPNTGPVLLSGDLYHYPEERTLDRVPAIDADADQTRASRQAMEEFLAEEGAALWIQHDRAASRSLKLSPEYYD